eukprot:6866827-Prymnesium_polylepis.1
MWPRVGPARPCARTRCAVRRELAVASSTVVAGAAVPSGMSGARGNRAATRGGVLVGVCGPCRAGPIRAPRPVWCK